MVEEMVTIREMSNQGDEQQVVPISQVVDVLRERLNDTVDTLEEALIGQSFVIKSDELPAQVGQTVTDLQSFLQSIGPNKQVMPMPQYQGG